jgi:hypothetical protein
MKFVPTSSTAGDLQLEIAMQAGSLVLESYNTSSETFEGSKLLHVGVKTNHIHPKYQNKGAKRNSLRFLFPV